METVEKSLTTAGGRKVDTTSYYVIEKDGNGFETKHLNFNNPEVCPRKGYIILEPLRNGKRANNKLSTRGFNDTSSGTQVYAGIPIGYDRETKAFVYQQIMVQDTEMLDLTVERDAKKWAVIRLHPYLEGSPNNKNNIPTYKVLDEERRAEVKLAKRAIKRKASVNAEGLYGKELVDMCRMAGINTKMSPTRLSVAIVDFAEENPEKFMEYYDSPVRQQNFIFKNALEIGVITQDPIIGYLFRGLPLGQTEPQSVEYLKEHPQTSRAIASEVELKESDSVKAMYKDTGKPKDQKDVLVEQQAEEIAALRKRLQEQEESNIKAERTNGDPKTELEMLRDEAKALGVPKSWMKNEETLRKEIAEKKTNN